MPWCNRHFYAHAIAPCPFCQREENLRYSRMMEIVAMKNAAPTEAQLNDPEWWAKVAPPNATHIARLPSGETEWQKRLPGKVTQRWSERSQTWEDIGPASAGTMTVRPANPAAPSKSERLAKHIAERDAFLAEDAPAATDPKNINVNTVVCGEHGLYFGLTACPGCAKAKLTAPEWDGTGNPQVGCECEIAASTKYLTVRYPEGAKVKIYARFIDDRGVELFAFVDEAGKVGGVATAKCFRPIRTQAEREREEVAQIIWKYGENLNIKKARAAADALYDAGLLRKGE